MTYVEQVLGCLELRKKRLLEATQLMLYLRYTFFSHVT